MRAARKQRAALGRGGEMNKVVAVLASRRVTWGELVTSVWLHVQNWTRAEEYETRVEGARCRTRRASKECAVAGARRLLEVA